ncbi:MAG TPA: response regulator [Anaeromyxobacteraceae bacterium]|nr:response regulator [Anaeromyxobacteraceae bacterium]
MSRRAHWVNEGRARLPLDHSKYRRLCERRGVRHGAGVVEPPASSLAFAAVRRSSTGMALLGEGRFLLRNARWLSLEHQSGEWKNGDRTYPDLPAMALGEADVLAHRRGRIRELRFARRGNEVDVVVEVRLELLRRVPCLAFVMVRDVTEMVRAERRESEARSDAAELRRRQGLGQLASAVAHEMNNALHAMALRLGLLRDRVQGNEGLADVSALSRMLLETAERVSRLEQETGRAVGSDRPGTGWQLRGDVSPAPGLRVLVVDDDPEVLEAAGLALRHLHQRVDLASSGAEAIARFTSGERFDLVLCDIGMPQLDGWGVAREVQVLAPGTRLYLVSGWARELGPERVRGVGAAGLLPKPVSLETLRALLASTIQTMCQPSGAPP